MLRAMYLLILVGQGTIQWPVLIQSGAVVPFWRGVGGAMLGALALLCALGVRYPLTMLPLMFFELAWKLIWVLAILLPKWLAGQIDLATAESAPSILLGVIVPIIMPWPYVMEHYVRRAGDSWRWSARPNLDIG